MTPTILIFVAICVIVTNIVMTYGIVKDFAPDILPDDVTRILLRICLIPPTGIAIAFLGMVSLLVAWIIMMVLDSWNH